MNKNTDLDVVAISSSDVSSDEAQDNVGEQPLDVVNIRQNLRRKMTLCPTKPISISVKTQTNHSGPIHTHQQFQESASI